MEKHNEINDDGFATCPHCGALIDHLDALVSVRMSMELTGDNWQGFAQDALDDGEISGYECPECYAEIDPDYFLESDDHED